MRGKKLKLVPPTAAQSYLIAAEQLYSGVKALLKSIPGVELAYSVLAAQALECALKAYLAQHGYKKEDLTKPRVRHNLEALWSMSGKELLGISPDPPSWCVTLNSAHNKPYYFRIRWACAVWSIQIYKKLKRG